MPVEVIVDDDLDLAMPTSTFDSWHQALCQRMAEVPGIDNRQRVDGDVCVSLVDAAQSRELNLTYREKDKPTNVLSFPAQVDLPEIKLLGDVAICYPLVVSEARAQGKTTVDHLAHLFIHGVLHLLGFDHETAAEAGTMEELERGILATLDIADPYVLREK